MTVFASHVSTLAKNFDTFEWSKVLLETTSVTTYTLYKKFVDRENKLFMWQLVNSLYFVVCRCCQQQTQCCHHWLLSWWTLPFLPTALPCHGSELRIQSVKVCYWQYLLKKEIKMKWLGFYFLTIDYPQCNVFRLFWRGFGVDSKEIWKAKKCYLCKHWPFGAHWRGLSTGIKLLKFETFLSR